VEIDSAREHYVEAGRARFRADHAAALRCDVRVPGSRSRDAGRQRGALALDRCAALRGHADTSVGFPLRRNPEPRNARHVTGRTVTDSCGGLLALPIAREVT